MMKIERALAGAILFLLASPAATAPQLGRAEEEIVFIRHGEKPDAGLGQLDCRGLNRSLVLPQAIIAAVGQPDAIWAANPSQQKEDHGVAYNYVRPLATIEPTAIVLGLPVHTDFSLDRPDSLIAAVDSRQYDGKRVLVAWEHKQIVLMARSLLERYGGDRNEIPEWPKDDFDSIYIVRINRSGSTAAAKFLRTSENIVNPSGQYP